MAQLCLVTLQNSAVEIVTLQDPTKCIMTLQDIGGGGGIAITYIPTFRTRRR